MKIKSQKDFWSGIMFVVLGVAFALGATNYSFGSSARPGPAYFPFGLGVLQAMLGAFILFKALVVETDSGDPIGRWAWKPLLTISGSVAVFAWAMPSSGKAQANTATDPEMVSSGFQAQRPIGSPLSVSTTSALNRMKAPSMACSTPRPNGK